TRWNRFSVRYRRLESDGVFPRASQRLPLRVDPAKIIDGLRGGVTCESKHRVDAPHTVVSATCSESRRRYVPAVAWSASEWCGKINDWADFLSGHFHLLAHQLIHELWLPLLPEFDSEILEPGQYRLNLALWLRIFIHGRRKD